MPEPANSPETLYKCSRGANFILMCGVPPAVCLQTQTEIHVIFFPLWCQHCLQGSGQDRWGGRSSGASGLTEAIGVHGTDPERRQHQGYHSLVSGLAFSLWLNKPSPETQNWSFQTLW